MGQEEYSLIEVMSLLGLSHYPTGLPNPAIGAGLVERTISDKPKSPKQRYRLSV